MTMRVFLLVLVAVGWWRVPGVSRENLNGIARALVMLVASMIGLAFLATPLIDLLDIDAETFRIASALVVMVLGASRALGAGRRVEDGTHLASWLLPLTYPVLIGPETVLVAISVGADEGVILVGIAAVVGSALALGASRSRLDKFRVDLVVRAGGVVLVVLAVAMLFDGLREI